MKKIMYLLLLLLLLSFNANAEVILKFGKVASAFPDDTNYGGIWLEQDNCQQCISLFGMELNNDDLVTNRIAGIDWTYKAFYRPEAGTVRFSIGYSIAEKPVNDSEQFNFHLGLALVGYKAFFNHISFGLYYDHFSNGRTVLDRNHIQENEPLDLLSIGFGF